MSGWNVFSNHGHVLLYLARKPNARLRDVAANVGITERAVQKIVRDMQEDGVVEVTKVGRRNQYAIEGPAALRHPLESHCTVGEVIRLIAKAPIEQAQPAVPVQPVTAVTGRSAPGPGDHSETARPEPLKSRKVPPEKPQSEKSKPEKPESENSKTEKPESSRGRAKKDPPSSEQGSLF